MSLVSRTQTTGTNRALYIGETARNLFTRSLEHMKNKDEEAFIKEHTDECHKGQESNFTAKVTHTNRDCLTRQIREGVGINRSVRTLLNSKSEWFQPPLYCI